MPSSVVVCCVIFVAIANGATAFSHNDRLWNGRFWREAVIRRNTDVV
jgi:hypothetical protein